jgi:hypothetical protein
MNGPFLALIMISTCQGDNVCNILGLAERRNQADSTKTIILVQNLLLVKVLDKGW